MERKKKREQWIDPALTQIPGAAEEGRGLRYLVRALNRAYTKLVEAELGRHLDITYAQWSFIRALSHEDGISQRELSNRVGLMENTTLVAVNLMEKRGWLRRVRDKKDKRRLLVYLTDKGRAVHRLRPLVLEANRAAVRDIDDRTVETTRMALKAMLGNLEDALEESTRRRKQQPKPRTLRRARGERPGAAAE